MKSDRRRYEGWTSDGLLLAGASLTAYGLWLAWPPLGFIAGGLALGAAGLALVPGDRP